MNIAEQYRARAVECEGLAKNARNGAMKRDFEEAARSWRNLADIQDRLGENTTDPGGCETGNSSGSPA
jgi:hypothetical protein